MLPLWRSVSTSCGKGRKTQRLLRFSVAIVCTVQVTRWKESNIKSGRMFADLLELPVGRRSLARPVVLSTLAGGCERDLVSACGFGFFVVEVLRRLTQRAQSSEGTGKPPRRPLAPRSHDSLELKLQTRRSWATKGFVLNYALILWYITEVDATYTNAQGCWIHSIILYIYLMTE